MIVFLLLIASVPVQTQFQGPTNPADAHQANRIIRQLVHAFDTLNFTNWDTEFDPNAKLETCDKDDWTPAEFVKLVRKHRYYFPDDFTLKYGLIYAYRESAFQGITFKVHLQFNVSPWFHHDIRITLQESILGKWIWVNAWQDNCVNQVSHDPFVVDEDSLIVKKMKSMQKS